MCLSKMVGTRLAFKFGSWKPTASEWILAAQCVQIEEKERIGKFVFKKDAKSSMIGRLMLRHAVCDSLKIPYNDVQLGRTEKGKPFLKNPVEQFLSFNVSHSGDWTVLATDTQYDVGIDVMKIEEPGGSRTVEDFFHNMRKQFTAHEWETIRSPGLEIDQLGMFYRHWCLKESFVKAEGTGIGFDLKRIDFRISTLKLQHGRITADTTVFVDGKLQDEWEFQETMLDTNHCTAVAVKKNDSCRKEDTEYPQFQIVSFEDLIKNAEPITEPDVAYWENFDRREERPNRKH